ncbi:MAG: hypothetical protein Q8936_09005 [Bacillota bacterium]|nr:hypothetical protein [Bacillota bacterium]
MLLAVQIIGIISMVTFVFIGIWGFITITQIYGEIKYKNRLMEKLIKNIATLSSSVDGSIDTNLKEENINSDSTLVTFLEDDPNRISNEISTADDDNNSILNIIDEKN